MIGRQAIAVKTIFNTIKKCAFSSIEVHRHRAIGRQPDLTAHATRTITTMESQQWPTLHHNTSLKIKKSKRKIIFYEFHFVLRYSWQAIEFLIELLNYYIIYTHI